MRKLSIAIVIVVIAAAAAVLFRFQSPHSATIYRSGSRIVARSTPLYLRVPGAAQCSVPTIGDRLAFEGDIPRDDIGQVAAAYAALFVAARGGALGLFTAIARLRAVHERIAPALEARGLALLAQHVDAMSTFNGPTTVAVSATAPFEIVE